MLTNMALFRVVLHFHIYLIKKYTHTHLEFYNYTKITLNILNLHISLITKRIF